MRFQRLVTTAALLLLLAGAALAQVQAVGPTITCRPDARQQSSAFVPGAVILCFGRIFDTTPDAFSTLQIRVTLVNPPPGSTKNLRINYVGTNQMSFSINVPSVTGATGFHFVGFGINEIVVLPDSGPSAPAAAKPTITPTGAYYSFQNRTPRNFNGTIEFDSLVSILTIALIGSDFGSISDWIVRFEGPVTVEVPAQAISISQAFPANLLLQLGGPLPTGNYSVSARAATNPAIVSNTISIFIP